jgi:hypothetical protein
MFRPAVTSVLCLWFTVSAAVAGAQAPAPRSTPPAKRPAPSTTTRPAAKTERAVPFAVGETLRYDVAWANYMTAGSATLSVREKKPSYGSTAYYITAEGQPISLLQRIYPVYYKADTLLDVFTLLPQRASVYSNENGRERVKTTVFDQAKRTASYEVRTATETSRSLAIPARSLDLLAAVYALRSLAFAPGASTTMSVVDAGEVFGVKAQVAGREPVRTAGGEVVAWRVEPRVLGADAEAAGARQIAVWITDDARRVPVKMAADTAVGTFTFTLREAK